MFNQLDEPKKLRIINAAMKEFADKGYTSASTNEIARKAGISKGSLFHYFGTKEKLYYYLMDYGTRIVEDAVYENDQLVQADFIEVLIHSAVLKLKVFMEYPALMAFFFRLYQDEPVDQARWDGKLVKILEKFQSRALSQVDASRFRHDLSTEEALRITYWIIDGMGRDYVNSGQSLEPEKLKALTADMLATLKKLLYKEEYQ